jgi:hypothetical protein
MKKLDNPGMLQAMKSEKTRNIMKKIIWDYDIDPYDLYEVVCGRKERIGQFDATRVFVRMLEILSWYELIAVLGLEFIKCRLTMDVISQLRFKDQRNRYGFIRKILQGESVSFSGWSPEYRERIKHTLLSNRWYSA